MSHVEKVYPVLCRSSLMFHVKFVSSYELHEVVLVHEVLHYFFKSEWYFSWWSVHFFEVFVLSFHNPLVWRVSFNMSALNLKDFSFAPFSWSCCFQYFSVCISGWCYFEYNMSWVSLIYTIFSLQRFLFSVPILLNSEKFLSMISSSHFPSCSSGTLILIYCLLNTS